MFNTVLLALHAAALIIFSSQSKLCVMASPVPISSTRAYMTATLSLRTELNATQDERPLASMVLLGRDISTDFRSLSPTNAAHSSTTRLLPRRDALWQYYHQAKENRNKLQSLAKRSSNVDPNDVDFQNSCISQASAYQSNLFNLQTLLASLGSDKGLKFYDSTNDLETLLKEIVDLNKSALGDISVIVDEMPILGPLLGPIVYQVKCILDNLLDLCENVADATINALQPLLKAIIGQTTTMSCSMGVYIVGLCL